MSTTRTVRDFFNDYLNIPRMIEEKRVYRQQMARVDALPDDYRYVFKKIQHHMWMFAAGSGYDMMKIHYELIELFEEGAANGKGVLEVTGKDVAAFCDELLRSTQTYTENWREKLNRDVAERLGKKGGS
jgi:DNA-binding ferritin-like protein (Dps family)